MPAKASGSPAPVSRLDESPKCARWFRRFSTTGCLQSRSLSAAPSLPSSAEFGVLLDRVEADLDTIH
jgi:hypothetical protein